MCNWSGGISLDALRDHSAVHTCCCWWCHCSLSVDESSALKNANWVSSCLRGLRQYSGTYTWIFSLDSLNDEPKTFLSFIFDSNHKDFGNFKWTVDSSDVSTCPSNTTVFLYLAKPALLTQPRCHFATFLSILFHFWHFVYFSRALQQAGNDCFNGEKCSLAPAPSQLQGSRRRISRTIIAADIHSFVRQFYWKGHFVNFYWSRWELKSDYSVLTLLPFAGRNCQSQCHLYNFFEFYFENSRLTLIKCLKAPNVPVSH